MELLPIPMIELAFTTGPITLVDYNDQENSLLSLFSKIKSSDVTRVENLVRAARIFMTPTLAALAVLTLMIVPVTGMTTEMDTIVFLVRHAEKMEETQDPGLSEAGRQRSLELAQLLRDAEIDHIHSTDFNRSMDTAAPLADLLGLEVELYSWDEAAEFAHSLIKPGKRHLVVGHSNTTTELVTLLGGAPGPEIDHVSEYDRLYLLTISADGRVTTVLIRYGIPYRNPNA